MIQATEMDGVALSLVALGRRGPSGRNLAVATVAEAVRRGVRRIDVTEGPDLEFALSVLAEAVPRGTPPIEMFVPSGPAARSPTGALAKLRVIEVASDLEPRDARRPSPSTEYGVRWPLETPWTERPGSEVPATLRWLVVRGSLLQPSRVRRVVRSAASSGILVLLTDPFAGGLLSGGGPVGPNFDAQRPATPWDVASLRRAYAPVLRLGFLTASGKRTLPQAAVGFARAVGAVVSLPVADRGDLDAWLDPTRSAALSDAETAQLFELDEPSE